MLAKRHTKMGLALWACTMATLAAPAIGQDIGVMGPSFAGADGRPTESKPQSKVWHHAGAWWASLWSADALAYHIHRLDADLQTWVDTGTVVDARPKSRSDILSDGDALYVGSNQFTSGAGAPGLDIDILRYSYDAGTETYALDPGFPVTIGNSDTESLVITKDSTGTVWAVWMQDLRVQVTHTLGSDDVWSAPVTLPSNTEDVTADDICSIIHFGGDRIGVLWSQQNSDAMRFSVHVDGAPDTEWSDAEPALAGPGLADDHINLAAAGDGRVFAATKDASNTIHLLVRDASGWSDFVVAEPVDSLTLPVVVLNEETRMVHVFASSRGAIVEKVASMDALEFTPGAGMPVMRDEDNLELNDPTSVKANVTGQTGLVVLAGHELTQFYWHHVVEASNEATLAAFSANGVAGTAPLSVQFMDTSTGAPTSWAWDFGDGGTSTDQHPEHTYVDPGTFTVSLTAEGPGGIDTAIRTDLIVVDEPMVGGPDLVLVGPVPGRVGRTNRWHVNGASEDRYVIYYAALHRGSHTTFLSHCTGGAIVDLDQPRFYGYNRARGETSTIFRRVPPLLRGRTVFFQAVDVFTCRVSNVTSVRY